MHIETFIDRAKAMIRSSDPAVRAKALAAGEAIMCLNPEYAKLFKKAMNPSAVHQDGTLTQISVQYANEDYIGLRLLPVVQIDKTGGYYFKYGQRDRLATPDDAVGLRSKPNEVNETRTKVQVQSNPYALEGFIDDRTLRAADAPLNEMIDLVQSVNDDIAFKEESRIATVMTTSGNFGSNTAALAAADRWDTLAGGDPVKNIQDARDALWQSKAPNDVWMYSGNVVYRTLSRHPRILDLFKNQTSGLATPDMIARFFDCAGYLVGGARQDTANIGQTASYSRMWGADSFGMARVARSPSIRAATFGFTFRFGQKITSQWFDPEPGISGGYYAKVGVDETHDVTASDTGWLYTTVVG